jgi:hypothetical protein
MNQAFIPCPVSPAPMLRWASPPSCGNGAPVLWKGLWQQLTGVELRHVCGFNIPYLTHERHDAVKRVCRKARPIKSVFRGAKL